MKRDPVQRTNNRQASARAQPRTQLRPCPYGLNGQTARDLRVRIDTVDLPEIYYRLQRRAGGDGVLSRPRRSWVSRPRPTVPRFVPPGLRSLHLPVEHGQQSVRRSPCRRLRARPGQAARTTGIGMRAPFCHLFRQKLLRRFPLWPRSSAAKRDAATVNLLAPRIGDLGIQACLETLILRSAGHSTVRTRHNSGKSSISSMRFKYATPPVPPVPRLKPITRSTVVA